MHLIIDQISTLRILYIFTKIVPQHYILVNDTTLASDNLLCLKKNFQKEYKKLIAKMS